MTATRRRFSIAYFEEPFSTVNDSFGLAISVSIRENLSRSALIRAISDLADFRSCNACRPAWRSLCSEAFSVNALLNPFISVIASDTFQSLAFLYALSSFPWRCKANVHVAMHAALPTPPIQASAWSNGNCLSRRSISTSVSSSNKLGGSAQVAPIHLGCPPRTQFFTRRRAVETLRCGVSHV